MRLMQGLYPTDFIGTEEVRLPARAGSSASATKLVDKEKKVFAFLKVCENDSDE